MPQFGKIARCAALALECGAVAAYLAFPRAFGDAPFSRGAQSDWLRRLDPTRSLFDWIALGSLRVLALTVLWCTRLAAVASKRALQNWAAMHGALVLACVGILAYRSVRLDAGSKNALTAREAAFGVSLAAVHLAALKCFGGAIDVLQTDAALPCDREVYFLGSLEQMARSVGVHPDQLAQLLGGPTAGPETPRSALQDDAQAALLSPPDRAQSDGAHSAQAALRRFATRGASIRAFWAAHLAREVDRARALARDIEDGIFRPTAVSNHQRVFALLLRLFAHENVLKDLERVFRKDPRVLAFHSLQLATFVLFGAFWDGPALRDLLLALCVGDARFAHRVEWYLRAFASGEMTQVAASEMTDNGVGSRHQRREKRRRQARHPRETDAQNGHRARPDLRLTPQGERAVAALRRDVRDAGEAPAAAWRAAAHKQEEAMIAPREGDEAKEADGVPRARARPLEQGEKCFDATLLFVEALTEVSRGLCDEKREDRSKLLGERLEAVNARFLPSLAAYIPLGFEGRRHRVVRIHTDESKVFSTKERCPFLACIEVIDLDDEAPASLYSPSPRKRVLVKPQTHETDELLGQWSSSADADAPPRVFESFFSATRPPRGSETTPPRTPPPTPPRGAAAALAAARGEAPRLPVDATSYASPQTPRLLGDASSTPTDGAGYGSILDRGAADGEMGMLKTPSTVLAPRAPRRTPPRSRPAAPTPPRADAFGSAHDATAPRPTVVFRERWSAVEKRLRTKAGCDDVAGWRLVPVIVKARDDLRQEQFAAQLFAQAAAILRDADVPVWLSPYDVLATAPDAGLIEAVPDTVSLDALRRNDPDYDTLLDFFQRHFGASGPRLAQARANFVESLAPACIMSYLLQLKDRHNGNILLDAQGRVSHIDFGYMLLSRLCRVQEGSPGGNMGFEAAPFKLTTEFLDVVGPEHFWRFRELCLRTFLALRRDRHRLVLLAEMTVSGCDHLPCFAGQPREAIDAMQRRFKPKLSERQCRLFVHGLIDKATNHWRTTLYDKYQRCCVGIL